MFVLGAPDQQEIDQLVRFCYDPDVPGDRELDWSRRGNPGLMARVDAEADRTLYYICMSMLFMI